MFPVINNTEISIPVHTAFYMLVNASAIHDFCTHMAKAEIPRGETAWSKKIPHMLISSKTAKLSSKWIYPINTHIYENMCLFLYICFLSTTFFLSQLIPFLKSQLSQV